MKNLTNLTPETTTTQQVKIKKTVFTTTNSSLDQFGNFSYELTKGKTQKTLRYFPKNKSNEYKWQMTGIDAAGRMTCVWLENDQVTFLNN